MYTTCVCVFVIVVHVYNTCLSKYLIWHIVISLPQKELHIIKLYRGSGASIPLTSIYVHVYYMYMYMYIVQGVQCY